MADDTKITNNLNIFDLDIPFSLIFSCSKALNAISNFGVLAVVTWQVLVVAIPLVYATLRLQRYYFAAAKELMRLNGTTRSLLANHLAESISGTMTIRAFEEEEQFLAKNYELIDKNASPFFHNFAATEWLIQRLEIVSSAILSSSALVMVLLPPGTFSPGKSIICPLVLRARASCSQTLLAQICKYHTDIKKIITVTNSTSCNGMKVRKHLHKKLEY